MNDGGQIVGSSGTCNALVPATSLHAVLWPNGPNGGVIDLGNLGGPLWNIAFYINNRGQVVGQSGVPGLTTFHAFLWTKETGMKDLGTLPGDIWSWANNINNKGQAVGTSFPATGGRAFIWQDGVMTDLNIMIPPGSPLYLDEAFGINDKGQIAGFGHLVNGEQRAYLLDPCGDNREGCQDAVDTNIAPRTQSAVHESPGTMLPRSPLFRRNSLFHIPASVPQN
jgi:probable HAF family extracellular repeat protein